MRRPISDDQVQKLVVKHILPLAKMQPSPQRLMLQGMKAYFEYLDFNKLPPIRDDEQKWFQELKFFKTLNMYFPDQLRWEQSRIYNLLLQYYDATKCGAIITKDKGNKILLVQDRRTGKHGLPKGKIYEEETEELCAIRQVKQETGFDIILEGHKMVFNIKCQLGQYVIFRARLDESNPQIDEVICEGKDYNCEVTKWAWISVKELKNKLRTHEKWMNLCTQFALATYFKQIKSQSKK